MFYLIQRLANVKRRWEWWYNMSEGPKALLLFAACLGRKVHPEGGTKYIMQYNMIFQKLFKWKLQCLFHISEYAASFIKSEGPMKVCCIEEEESNNQERQKY